MAWYALYKWFRPWRKAPYVNRIQQYKELLERQWYESLSPVEQMRYMKKKEESRRDARSALMFMLAFNAACRLGRERPMHISKDSYFIDDFDEEDYDDE